MKTRIGEIFGWAILMAVLSALGWILMATSFMPYDDEGYVLHSVQRFCEGRPLYSEVFSQYGPGYFLVYRALHALTGLVYTHDVGRIITWIYWLGTASILGLLARRLSGNMVAGWTAATLGFICLAVNTSEPFHPGSLLALLAAISALIGAEGIIRGSMRRAGYAIAALGTLMLLIKINVGLFMLAAWGLWWLAQTTRETRYARGVMTGIYCMVLVVPMLLMRVHLPEPWVLGFACTFIASALAIILLQSEGAPSGDKGSPTFLWLLVPVVSLPTICIIMALLGTSPPELLQGMLIRPLRQPGIYTFPTHHNLRNGLLAIISASVAIWLARQPASPSKRHILFATKTAVVIISLSLIVTGPMWEQLPGIFLLLGPLLAIWLLIPNGDLPTKQIKARWWVAWIYIWQTLHAYPVAGSQSAWGSVLWVVVLSVGVVDFCSEFKSRWRPAGRLGTYALIGISLLSITHASRRAQTWWAHSAPISLPGAKSLRPQPDIARCIQVINANLRENADTVFTLPGMLSFNMWSGRPTPTEANATHWFSLLNDAEQQEIITALENDPRAMLVVNRDLLTFLQLTGVTPSGPLADYLRENFISMVRIGPYDLCVKRGRSILSYETFEVKEGIIIAWVLQNEGNTTVRLRNPARPDWPGVILQEAAWRESSDGHWLVMAPMPGDWPEDHAREMIIGDDQPRTIIENTIRPPANSPPPPIRYEKQCF